MTAAGASAERYCLPAAATCARNTRSASPTRDASFRAGFPSARRARKARNAAAAARSIQDRVIVSPPATSASERSHASG